MNSMTRLLAFSTAFLFLCTAAVFSFYTVFSRSMSLDEGYLMMTIQSFSEGHPLYDTVFTQYGPFYYIYEWLAHTVGFVPLTHDATRLLCIFHWLTAATLLGWGSARLMKSVPAGLFVFAESAIQLAPLANEPGHPQELVALLLALAFFLTTRQAAKTTRSGEPAFAVNPRTPSAPFQALAVVTAFLVLTKINVGIFFGFALFLMIRCHSRDRFARGGWIWLLVALCATIPFVLMRHHLTAEWCRNCAILIAYAVMASLAVGVRTGAEERGLQSAGVQGECGWPQRLRQQFSGSTFLRTEVRAPFVHLARLALFFLVPASAIVAIVLFHGTSLHGLMDGLLLTPLKMSSVALLPLPLPRLALLNAAVALAASILASLRPAWLHRSGALNLIKLLYGLAGAAFLLGNSKAQFGYLLPWVWLVLVPSASTEPADSLPRLFLSLAAVWQSLQIYPIAGTQVTTATLLLVPSYALCIWDAALALGAYFQTLPACRSRREGAQIEIRNKVSLLTSAPTILFVTGLALLFAILTHRLAQVRREYASLPALDLPGSRLVHMDSEIVEMYRALAKYLGTECDTFVTYPGINSLYFWSGKRPPTHLNSTGWGQLSYQQQERILASLRDSPRPMLVVVAAEAQRWASYTPAPIAPLVRCVREDCHEVARLGRFIIFVPHKNGLAKDGDGIGVAGQPR